jgi:subtilisin family serine protease
LTAVTQKPVRTVLDAALRSLALKQASPDPSLVPVPLETLAASRAALAPPPAAPGAVELKVLTAAGRERDAADWLRSVGGKVTSTGPQVLVATVPPAILDRLDQCPGIGRAEAPRRLMRRLDQARGPASGCAVAQAAHNLDGTGVVMGIVDTGVDWAHPDFTDDQGRTRLELFAFARQPEGAQVSQLDEFDSATLDAALSGGGAVPQGDPQGHGTHCASIALGNGRASNGQLRGVASGARLVAVRSEPLLDTHTIFGIRRTFELAGDRPAVVTLSLGGHLGPHDGTSALENVIARESGPGRIVVVAAGNEGGDAIHFRGELQSGQDLVIPVRINDAGLQFVDVWVPRGDDVDVEIETPDGVRHPANGSLVTTVFGLFEAHFQEDPINRDQNLTLFVAQGRLNHTWNIRIHANQVVHGEVHAWAGTVNSSTSAHLFPGADDRFSIGMPATEERCLAVGSLVSRNQFETAGGTLTSTLTLGQLSPFSSRGPTRYGALKPDVAAPGQFVTAALAAGSELALDPVFVPRHHPSGRYITIQGTSMATPFVAGVIALLLQREPTLTPEDVQQRLRITARRDAQTGRVWDAGFGFGRLDVQALLDYQA